MVEDFERVHEMDQMYIVEWQLQMEQDWQQWDHEQQHVPAKIQVNGKEIKRRIKKGTRRKIRKSNPGHYRGCH